MIGALMLLLWQGPAEAPARPVGPAPVYEAARTRSAILVDGKLDDAAWSNAARVELTFPWEQQKGAKQKTTVRLLWDDVYLYAAYDCEDKDVTAKFLERDDPTYMDDAVELYINPDPTRPLAYYGLEMNARGVLYDYLMLFPGPRLIKRFNLSGVQLATTIRGTLNEADGTDQGWTLELAIPWVNFNDLAETPPKPGSSWAIQLVRWDGTEPARRLSIWSDSGNVQPSPHNPKRLGTVRWMGPR